MSDKSISEQLKVAGYTETHSGGLTIIHAPNHVIVGINAVPDEARAEAYKHLKESAKNEHR